MRWAGGGGGGVEGDAGWAGGGRQPPARPSRCREPAPACSRTHLTHTRTLPPLAHHPTHPPTPTHTLATRPPMATQVHRLNEEGIVLKKLAAIWESNERSSSWCKFVLPARLPARPPAR